MAKTLKRILLASLSLALALSACSPKAPATPTPLSPDAVLTAAVRTAEAMGMQRFGQTPSPLPTEELGVTAAAVTPTTPPATPPGAALTPGRTPSGAPPNAPPANLADKAEYVADVTVPDGTTFAPGEAFEKTWRIRNSGSTTWNTAYQLVFIDGNLLGAEQSISLPQDTAPGQEVDITVKMTAPETAGNFVSYWKLRNPAGQAFGLGVDGKEAIWVKITVAAQPEAAGAATPAASAQVNEVSGVSLQVDQANVSGACPHVFTFTATVVMKQATAVSYYLEVGGEGAAVVAPLPASRNWTSGPHTVVFELSVSEAFTGWARLRLTQPGALTSEQVNFSLSCG